MIRTAKGAMQIVALAAVAALLALLVWKLTHQNHAPKVGATAPAFTLQRLGGNGRVDLAALRGRPVVINFWASWCAPCKSEAKVLEKAWTTYRGRGVTFLGVDYHDVTSDAEHFVAAHELTFPMVEDGSGSITESKYGVTQVPETFVLDRTGKIVVHVPGPVTAESLRAALDRASSS